MDTNVVIDFLANRVPFSTDAAQLFKYALDGNAHILISAISYSNIYYIIRQSTSSNIAVTLLNELSDITAIIDVTDEIIRQSLKSNFKDNEDAIQYHCALSIPELDFIVTRNTKDFKNSALPVLTPKEAIASLK